MPEPRRNLAQSVHQRLLSKAKERGEDFNLVLIRYALERFLYRLGRSRHKDRFILKGAMLFAAWTDQPHRPTRLKSGSPSTRMCGGRAWSTRRCGS